jgi:hypothetical protein
MLLTQKTDVAEDLSGTTFTMFMFGVSLFLVIVYIVLGPRLVDLENSLEEQE